MCIPGQEKTGEVVLVEPSDLQMTLESNKNVLQPYLALTYQPYKVTSANIKYIAEEIKPVCFISKDSGQGGPVTGMSFHTNVMCKAGRVIYTMYQVYTIEDFERHFKAHLQYILQNLVTDENEKFNIYVLFPTQLQFGKVLLTAFQHGLRPGIRTEGFLVISSTRQVIEAAKL